MLSQCPHCHKDLQLTEAQQEKVKQALAALPEGKTLKIACPLCREAINLQKDGTPLSAAPAAAPAAKEEENRPPESKPAAAAPKPVNPPPAPPAPPDNTWLQGGQEEGALEEVVKDVPLAMVLVTDNSLRQQLSTALEGLGYQVEFPENGAAAKERMRFVNFAAVVLHSAFEGGELAASAFHQHMRKLPMVTRRLMLYVLIGPRFNTLYDLEALANSANLVVNEKDAAKLPLILKKAQHEYQLLFGPYLEALQEHGKL